MNDGAKVVHLITLLELGGAQGNTIFTVRHLDRRRFDAELWTGRGAYWDDKAAATLADLGGVRWIRFLVRPVRPINDILAVIELVRLFRRVRPIIVHTHSSKAGIIGRLAAAAAGIPTVVHTFHGFGFNNRQNALTRFLYVALERWAARRSDALVFVSEANRMEAARRRIRARGRTELIRSGIDLAKIDRVRQAETRAAVRADLQLPLNAKVVTTIGPFKPQKNHVDFLRMARRVRDAVPEAVFLLVGDGALRSKIERTIADLDLRHSVRLMGWREDPERILLASDVFALTSLWEGLPRSLVEALAMKRPAVCYDTDGVRDLLSRGGGTIVPQGDWRAHAAAVTRHLTGAAGPIPASIDATIRNEFDIVQMVRRQEALYAALLAEKRPKAP